MLRNRAVLALVGWTLLIWTARIANVWRDDELDLAGKLADTGLASSFTLLALAVVVVGRRALRLLAAWTVLVWIVRSVDILTDDWSVGFKLVHTALGLVSVVLAVVAVRAAGTRHASPTTLASR